MNNVLVVVDVQNDFIDGTFRNEDAIKAVPNIINYIKNFDGKIIFTQDTHDKNYLNTLEGKKLPVAHCIFGTEGWMINNEVFKVAANSCKILDFVKKNTFGSFELVKALKHASEIEPIDNIILCGFCSNICVVNNALIIRAAFPNTKITVLKDCCAGTSKEAHEAALNVMQSCQINIE